MKLLEKVNKVLSNPKLTINYLRHSIDNNYLWQRFSKLCLAQGLKESQFILSFDCDTKEDIKAAWEVHSKLVDIGINAVYAVPGEILQKGEKVFRKIHETGAEFINHGGREHTYFDMERNRYASCFFYEQQTTKILEDDIEAGHRMLQEVLGITPNGFRTPHFGTFQKNNQLNFLHQFLKERNYLFSTSTVPSFGYQFGPAKKSKGIVEIPVTGMYSRPSAILDTWAFFMAPERKFNAKDYVEECRSLAEFASINPMLINIYADPCHIADNKYFFESMKILVKSSKNTNYNHFIRGHLV